MPPDRLGRDQYGNIPTDAVPQAAAKWRLLWRLAPRLLERWSATGRLNAINAAVSAVTKKVPFAWLLQLCA